MTAVETDHPAEVLLSLEGPRPQRRLTIAFRAILAIPHWLYALVLGIVGFFAVVVTWFVALALGRVPDGLRNFLTGILQYFTRVSGYGLYLMTDRYPRFSLSDGDYAVEALVPPPGRLHRAAVLFRIILMIPAWFVVSILGSGIGIAMFFVWLIVLITGRPPRSLYEALAAAIRYQVRAYAYFGMLTSEYPRGLFGDKVETTAPEAAPVDEDVLDLADAPPPSGVPLTDLPSAPRTTSLLLSTGAKRIVALFLVIGALTTVGGNAIGLANSSRGHAAANRLEDQHAVLEVAIRDFGTTIQSCGLDGGPACVHGADRDLAAALSRFRADLRNVSYPANALPLARTLEDDADELIGLLHQREATSDTAEYQRLTAEFQDRGATFDQDYLDLLFLLRTTNFKIG